MSDVLTRGSANASGSSPGADEGQPQKAGYSGSTGSSDLIFPSCVPPEPEMLEEELMLAGFDLLSTELINVNTLNHSAVLPGEELMLAGFDLLSTELINVNTLNHSAVLP